MKTLILPGYSLHNKSWAYDVKHYLDKHGRDCDVYEWKHWMGGKMDIKEEIKSLEYFIGNGEISVVAKSIGTKVFMQLFPKIESQVKKVILCGIPIDPKGYLGGIKKLGGDRLLIFQNSQDPFMPHSVVWAYVKLIDKNIKVIKKDAKTHDYPYFSEFLDFLNQG